MFVTLPSPGFEVLVVLFRTTLPSDLSDVQGEGSGADRRWTKTRSTTKQGLAAKHQGYQGYQGV